jgi:hypothetical protein
MIINAQGSKLAQIQPGDTSDTLAFTAVIQTEITRILVCNTAGSARTFRIFHADSGDSFSVDNALFYDYAIAAHDTVIIATDAPNAGIALQIGELLGVQASAADELTFTVYGVTASIAPGG